MIILKRVLASLLLLLALVQVSCKKCEGEGPKFNTNEKQLLTDLKQGDSLVFRSSTGARMYLYVFKREFWEPKDGDKAELPVKGGSATCAVDDEAEATIHLSTINSAIISDEVFVISFRKSIIATDVMFSGSMLQGDLITRSLAPDLDSLQVNGTLYRDIFTLEPNLNKPWQGTGPKSVKLYYTKNKGLIRFDNEGNETWERVN
jgi:hypothetical protein